MTTSPAGPRAAPFVQFVGGKRRLLPELRRYVPVSFGRYFEPFLGGGALFFDLAPAGAVLSDINPDLICAYRVVRDRPGDLLKALKRWKRDEDFYYKLRARDTTGMPDVERAARFVYIIKCGFNGLWRTNKSGGMNVPFGDSQNNISPHYGPEIAANIEACSKALAGAIIECRSFRSPIGRGPLRGDFVYFDPPYVPLTATANFTAYASDGFGIMEQRMLRDLAVSLRVKGVHVMLSNSSAPLVRTLYRGFDIHEVTVQRNVGCKAETRGEVKELIIT
jgi:DNA adenine methylase